MPKYFSKKEELLKLLEQSLQEFNEAKKYIENNKETINNSTNEIVVKYNQIRDVLNEKLDSIFQLSPEYKYLSLEGDNPFKFDENDNDKKKLKWFVYLIFYYLIDKSNS